jgi:hypothetical protein
MILGASMRKIAILLPGRKSKIVHKGFLVTPYHFIIHDHVRSTGMYTGKFGLSMGPALFC